VNLGFDTGLVEVHIIILIVKTIIDIRKITKTNNGNKGKKRTKDLCDSIIVYIYEGQRRECFTNKLGEYKYDIEVISHNPKPLYSQMALSLTNTKIRDCN